MMKSVSGTGVGDALLFSGFVIACILVAIMATRECRERDKRGFAAWEKLTGNSNHLSLQEWRDLRQSGNGQQYVVPVYIQH